MKKSEVCVKLTRKNCKKVLEILEMFGEECPYSAEGQIALQSESASFSFNGSYWCVRSHGLQTYIKPRELRNILAREYLKKGDVVVVNNPRHKKGWVIEFSGWGKDDAIYYSKGVIMWSDGNVHVQPADRIIGANFLRYATDEEKALLEPKVAGLKIEAGKSYRCIKDVVMTYSQKVEFIKGRTYSAKFNGCLTNESGNANHGAPPEFAARHFELQPKEEEKPEFGVDKIEFGVWYKCKSGGLCVYEEYGGFGFWRNETWRKWRGCSVTEKHNIRKATEAEVIEALTKECVKRYGEDWENVKIRAHASDDVHRNTSINKMYWHIVKTTYCVWNKNGNLFYKGKWAEPLKEPGQATYTREVWVNHYSDMEFHVHPTKDKAERYCRRDDCVEPVKATLTYDTPMTKV